MINKIYLRNPLKETILIIINKETYEIEPFSCPPLFLESGEYAVEIESRSYLLAFPVEKTFKIDKSGVIDFSINEQQDLVLNSEYYTS